MLVCVKASTVHITPDRSEGFSFVGWVRPEARLKRVMVSHVLGEIGRKFWFLDIYGYFCAPVTESLARAKESAYIHHVN